MPSEWEKLKEIFIADILKKRVIYLGEDITADMAADFGKAIVWLNTLDETEITVYIDSGGGDVGAGLDIYDMIKHSKAPIAGIVYRRANSMASVILQACKTRKAMKHSEILVHNISIGRRFDIWEEKFEEAFKPIKENQYNIYHIFSERSGLSLEKIKEMFKEEKKFNAEEAKEIGLIDEII